MIKDFKFREAFGQLDQILRGEATQISSLKKGQIELPIRNLVIVMIMLGVLYGVCLGSFNLLHPETPGAVATWKDAWLQLFASMIKFPLLIVMTLLITLPSLYVFNALVGSKLSFLSVQKLLVSSLAIMLTVLASLGPIVIFFSLCTTSYHFILLLNVVVCSVGGILCLAFLLRTLHRLIIAQEWDKHDEVRPEPVVVNEPEVATATAAGTLAATLAEDMAQAKKANLGTLEKVGQTDIRAKSVIRIWVVVFGLVGAQMSWVLRPFIGNPYAHFELFRDRESNFFMSVVNSLNSLLGG